MKIQFVNFAILNTAGVFSLTENATVFTDDSTVIIDFETEIERDEYLIENEIVFEAENLPDFNNPQ